jgi:prepilin-type N-terminal cleavage/methylation domain-containing protein
MKTNKGFTLVEVLVAMAVFSAALLALGRMQIVASQVSAAAGRLTRATALTQDKVEQLLALPYTNALLDDQTPVGQKTTYTDPNPPKGYTITWDVDADTPVAGVKTINLKVAWNNRGNPKSFQLAFYKER